jgi:hypothetical protein
MKKKIKRFQEGGFTKEQEEFLGGADRTDPYILARMRSKFPDAPKAAKADTGELRDETGALSKMRRNTETGELYSTEATAKPVPKNVSTSSQPAKSTPASKKTVEDKDETGRVSDIRRNPETGEMYSTKGSSAEKPKEEPKKAVKTTVPSEFGKVSLPKSFSTSGGNTEPKKSTAKFSPPNISLQDPLAKFKKQKSSDSAYNDAGYKKGGMVSSASKRADGCAIRGKTRA